tara:strand:+ start:1736 stop:2317 length:582 start_codon:yes stop_codon:yes gene_type:complete
MDEAKLINLFPKPLVLLENVFSDKLDFLESFLKQQKGFKRTTTQNVDTTFHTDTKLFEKEEIKFLSDFIYKKALSFIRQLEYSNSYITRCKYNEMWFNISNENDFLFPHHHGFCLVSGVYYIKAPKDSTITFYDQSYYYPNHIEIKKPNIYNSKDVNLDCKAGSMFLFKGDMVHGNTLQPKGEKIAISFNLGL